MLEPLRKKERAGGIHPPPFAGPDDDDRSRQRTEQVADEEASGSVQSVDNGGLLWQERAVDGATSN